MSLFDSVGEPPLGFYLEKWHKSSFWFRTFLLLWAIAVMHKQTHLTQVSYEGVQIIQKCTEF